MNMYYISILMEYKILKWYWLIEKGGEYRSIIGVGFCRIGRKKCRWLR